MTFWTDALGGHYRAEGIDMLHARLDDLVTGLKAIAKANTRLPGSVVMQPEYQLP